MQQCVIYQSRRFKRCCSYGDIIMVCYWSGLLGINCKPIAGWGETRYKQGRWDFLQVANYGDLPTKVVYSDQIYIIFIQTKKH